MRDCPVERERLIKGERATEHAEIGKSGQKRRMFKVIVQECKMSTESKKERANDVANGCKLIAVMWILIPINQGQCGLLCHLCMVGKRLQKCRNVLTYCYSNVIKDSRIEQEIWKI